jgi:ferredoxin
MCSTCRSKLVSGQVDMRQNGGLRPAEVAAGMILLCCSRPLSDLEIER